MKQQQTRRITHQQLEDQALLLKRKIQLQRRRAMTLGITETQLDEARELAREDAARMIADGTDLYMFGGQAHKIIGADQESLTVMPVSD